MKVTIDFENINVPIKSFETITKMFDGLFKETEIKFKNYNLVDNSIEDFAGTQFLLKTTAENLKK
jgi:hypothetical protein